MNKSIFVICSLVLTVFATSFMGNAQVTLNADGPGNTYELINSVFAPSGNVIETPDLMPDGSHSAFGRHIAEVFDTDLNKYVFEFYAHLDTGAYGITDNDISTLSNDRQRIEIKAYGSSPSNLKGTLGETVTYKWKFKIPIGFKPSANFTHIHQIKPVDGDDSNPIFTLTARKGTPNRMQLIYVVDENGRNDYKTEISLSLFEGIWVDVVEVIKIGTGTSGSYSILVKKVSDGTVLMTYSNNSIQTIRTAATDPNIPQVANSFIRPKWGIYRSLLDVASLRDDSIRFSDFSIAEGTLSTNQKFLENEIFLSPNPVRDILTVSEKTVALFSKICIYDANGKQVLNQKIDTNSIDISFLPAGMYFVKLSNTQMVSEPVKVIKF